MDAKHASGPRTPLPPKENSLLPALPLLLLQGGWLQDPCVETSDGTADPAPPCTPPICKLASTPCFGCWMVKLKDGVKLLLEWRPLLWVPLSIEPRQTNWELLRRVFDIVAQLQFPIAHCGPEPRKSVTSEKRPSKCAVAIVGLQSR